MILTVFYHVSQTFYDSSTNIIYNLSATIYNGMGSKKWND